MFLYFAFPFLFPLSSHAPIQFLYFHISPHSIVRLYAACTIYTFIIFPKSPQYKPLTLSRLFSALQFFIFLCSHQLTASPIPAAGIFLSLIRHTSFLSFIILFNQKNILQAPYYRACRMLFLSTLFSFWQYVHFIPSGQWQKPDNCLLPLLRLPLSLL